MTKLSEASKPADTSAPDHTMAKLAATLDICAPVLKGKLLFLDYPVHENIGDMLIWRGEKEFLKSHGKTVLGQYSLNNVELARRRLEECTTICFHGGGNIGDLYPWHQELREKIIREYSHKRIVILPQTVHFENQRELDKACALFRQHPDLHIFLRDRPSFAHLYSRDVPHLELCPDMAHALWGSLSVPPSTSSSPLYLLRRDKEKAELPPEIVTQNPGSTDWDDLLAGWLKGALALGVRVNEITNRKAKYLPPASRLWSALSDTMIRRAIGLFAAYETIVTDRLHGVILGALLGRNVIARDNSYGKVSSYVDCWLSDVPGISLEQ